MTSIVPPCRNLVVQIVPSRIPQYAEPGAVIDILGRREREPDGPDGPAMMKLGMRDRAQLVVTAFESGLVRPHRA
jgi:hypothetical protein